MLFKEPKVEFVGIVPTDTIATSAGYVNCENSGSTGLGSLAGLCLFYSSSMSNEEYSCRYNSVAMGSYTPPTPTPEP